jgi:hypothetical protein
MSFMTPIRTTPSVICCAAAAVLVSNAARQRVWRMRFILGSSRPPYAISTATEG